MNTTTVLGKSGGVLPQLKDYMADPKKRKKASFDAEDDVAEILEKISDKGFAKGALLNACVRLAWKSALDDLIVALRDVQKYEKPNGDPKPTKGNKP